MVEPAVERSRWQAVIQKFSGEPGTSKGLGVHSEKTGIGRRMKMRGGGLIWTIVGILAIIALLIFIFSAL